MINFSNFACIVEYVLPSIHWLAAVLLRERVQRLFFYHYELSLCPLQDFFYLAQSIMLIVVLTAQNLVTAV